MAGDRLDIGVNYYFRNITNSPPSGDIVQGVSMLLINLFGGSTATSNGHGFTSPSGFLGGGSYLDMQSFLQSCQLYSTAKPKAFINYLFFDENFNFVAYDPATGLGSYSKQVTDAGNHMQPLVADNITVPKNGYALVYVSNESTQQAVYFDNLAVTHTRRKILEETHYYAYGLKIQAISGQAFQKPTAPEKFQGNYSNFEEETGWNDFELRSYDPQIGRWLQNDPYGEFASGYVGMGNDPINNVDASGGGTGDDAAEYMSTVFVTALRRPPPAAKLLGLGAKVVQEVVRYSAVYFNYRNQQTGNEFRSPVNQPAITDAQGAWTNQGQGQDEYQSWEDVTSQHVAAQDATYRAAQNDCRVLAMIKQSVELHNFRKVRSVANQDYYENGLGEKKMVARPTALGNDELGSEIVFNAFTLGSGFWSKKAVTTGGELLANEGGENTLFHYTTEVGYNSIRASEELFPSTGFTHARFGPGQYFTDIAPHTTTAKNLTGKLFRFPVIKNKMTHFIEVDVSGLNVIKNAPYNYVIPGTSNLNLSGRIVNGGVANFLK